MMPMSFVFSDQVVLLFDFWSVHSAAGMVLSVAVVMLIAVLYEAVKVSKAKLIQRATPTPIATSVSQETLGEPERGSVSTGIGQLPSSPQKSWWFPWHVAQSLLHVVQVVLGYLVMLAVMSYNTWIFLGVIVGSAIGYYLAYPLLSIR
ncbi:protein SLC31A2 [Elgaria multicarinata webbii]|uniref:protein SLC31A2 n=1 Tax=Elgaria multicarinata webbii TaxID=159646 RepID=UPI002FCCD814